MTPIPQSVVDRAELLARSHPKQVVAEIIGVHPSQISEMIRRGWKAADYSSRKRPRPGDFSLWAHRLTTEQLMRHYRAGFPTIKRWMGELKERPASRKGWSLRTDPATGKRMYQVMRERALRQAQGERDG